MEHPMAPFLTVILLTFATDHICGQTIIASQNPLPVGSNVTLSLSNHTTIVVGTWAFEINNIVVIYDTGFFIYPKWLARVKFNRTSAELSISALQVTESGLYQLSGGIPSFEAKITLSVQEPIANVTLTANKANLVEFNDSAVFTCGVSSGSSLSYRWTNDSSVVPLAGDRVQFSGGDSVLTIAGVTRYDRGPFRCQVFNGISNGWSGPILLNISYGPSDPKIVSSPMMTAYKTGSNITLTCLAESHPTATVQWFFNETDLGWFDPQIQLQHTNETQMGYYKCLLHNAVTNRFSSVQTMINIMDPISSVAVRRVGGPVILGQSVTLSCDVNGHVESISWWKNGTSMTTYNMTSLTNKSLTLDPVVHSDAGDYQCQAFNFVSNMTSSPYRLIVNYGPETPAIEGPSSALVGQRVTIGCSASSQPPSQYRWYFNNLNDLNYSLMANASQYATGPLTLDMSGKYICMAFNNITGRNSSAYTMLTVYAPVAMAMVNTSGVHPILNNNFSLTCDTVGSVESIYWMKNDSALQTTSRIMLHKDNTTLTFSPVLLSDNGYYTCKASNPFSNLTSGRHALHVAHGPSTPVIAGPEVAALGQNITFSCSVDSYPASWFHWIFYSWSVMDNTTVGNTTVGNTSVGNTSEIELGPLTVHMSGVYKCFASNSITHQSDFAEKMLKVVDPVTHVQIQGPSSSAIQGLSFALRCNATGTVDHVYWMKNGEMLYAGNTTTLSMYNTTLTFNPVHKEDNGFYQCTAANAVNNMTSRTYGLRVIFGPYTPIIMGPLIAETGEDVVFNCSAFSYPPSHYHWYLNGTLVGYTSTYETGPLSLNMSGEYTCMAINEVTKKTSTNSTSLRVIEGIEYVAIKEDSLPIQTHNFTLSCEVAGPYDSMYWMKDGVQLGSCNGSTDVRSVDPLSTVSYYMKNNSLHFSPVTTYDDGVYRCVAVNEVRSHSSPEYELLVNYGPLSVHIDGPGTVHAGSAISVSFTCTADSRPTSRYQWFINVVPEIVEAGPHLSILATKPQVLIYTCKAYNNVTKISMSKSKILAINAAPSHSLASPGVLLFMTLSALSVPMLGDSLFN